MEIRLHRELPEFAALTRGLYAADPVTHTVALTVLAQRLGPLGAPDVGTLLTVHNGLAVVGAALRTPPWPLAVSGLSEAAAGPAVVALLGHDPSLDQVGGPRPRAEAFADAWCAATGASAHTVMAHRLFRLDELTPPSRVPGRARRAGVADLGLVLRWQLAFASEAVPEAPESTREQVRRQLGARRGRPRRRAVHRSCQPRVQLHLPPAGLPTGTRRRSARAARATDLTLCSRYRVDAQFGFDHG